MYVKEGDFMRKTLFYLTVLVLSLLIVGCSTSSANELESNKKGEDNIPEKEINFEDVRQEKTANYLKASIDYLDASIGDDLLINKVVKAEKVETGEKFNENKLDVEIALKDEFSNTPKGLALPELILLDLVKNKFNETGNSSINEVEFKVTANIDGNNEQVYKVKIDKEGYKKIHEDKVDLKRIYENADEHYLHEVYEKEIYNK